MEMIQLKETKNELIAPDDIRSFIKDEGIDMSFSELDIHLLSHGKETSLLKNIDYNGEVFDGRLFLQEDQYGKLILHIEKKKEMFQMPEKVNGITLSEQQKAELSQGKVLGPYGEDGSSFYVLFDQGLNKVTYRSEFKMGIPFHFAGYTFSSYERNDLANGKSVGPKVFKVNGEYILGTYKVENLDGFSSQEITVLKSKLNSLEVNELLQKYNIHSDGLVHIPSLLNLKNDREAFKDKTIFLTNEGTPFSIIDKDVKFIDQQGYLPVIYSKNDTFNFHTIAFDERLEFPKQIFNLPLTQEHLKLLKEEGVIKGLEIITIKGANLKVNLNYFKKDGYNVFVFQTNEQSLNNFMNLASKELIQNPFKDKFTLYDKQVLDLIDKRAFNELSVLVQKGLPISKDLLPVIQHSSNLSIIEKNVVTDILHIGDHSERPTSSKEKKQNYDIGTQKSNARVNNLQGDHQKNKGRKAEEIFDRASRPLRGLVHDM